MLQFCVVDGCTTVVMGRGTCLEHDGGPTGKRPSAPASRRSDARLGYRSRQGAWAGGVRGTHVGKRKRADGSDGR